MLYTVSMKKDEEIPMEVKVLDTKSGLSLAQLIIYSILSAIIGTICTIAFFFGAGSIYVLDIPQMLIFYFICNLLSYYLFHLYLKKKKVELKTALDKCTLLIMMTIVGYGFVFAINYLLSVIYKN